MRWGNGFGKSSKAPLELKPKRSEAVSSSNQRSSVVGLQPLGFISTISEMIAPPHMFVRLFSNLDEREIDRERNKAERGQCYI